MLQAIKKYTPSRFISMDCMNLQALSSEFNGIRVLAIDMLSRNAFIAFKPQAKVTALALSNDGKVSVWAEGDGLVCISNQKTDIDGSNLLYWKSNSKVTGLILNDDRIFVLDELEGLSCLDLQGKVIWQVEISGGGFCLEKIQNRFAIIDSLGRLHIIDFDGNELKLNNDYDSIINITSVSGLLILAHENGDVQALDESSTIWKRPSRGELGESITSIGATSRGDLIIGREGYALVPGDEEALELEIWNIESNKILHRTELSSRLTVSIPSKMGVICGFDDGKVAEIKLNDSANGKYSDDLSELMDCRHPIRNVIYFSDQIICSAWFFIFGITKDGSKWKVEHQGMPELVEISLDGSVCLFAGEDQNDWSDEQPIGKMSIIDDLIELDDSELTSWFDDVETNKTLTSEELYGSQQNIDQHLTEEEVEKLNQQPQFNIEESIDALIGALDFESRDFIDEKIKGTLDIDTDELISQLDDAIENLAMLPDDQILEELNSSIEEVQIPIADAGNDQIITSQDDETAIVTLDGSACFDPQNRITNLSWIDESGKEISEDCKFRVRLNIGKHRFELRICDVDGNWNSDSVSVIIE